MIDEALEELGYEDGKCARLLAALTVTAGAIVTAFFAGNWSPTNMTDVAQVAWYAGAAVVLVSIAIVGSGALAGGRRGRHHRERSRVAFWGHAAKLEDVDEVARALRHGATSEHRLSQVAERLWHLGRTLRRKRLRLRAGLAMAATGFALCVSAAPLNLVAR